MKRTQLSLQLRVYFVRCPLGKLLPKYAEMNEEGFRKWLEGKVKSVSNYVSRIKRIEKHYGDIDGHYEKDRCAWLLAQFVYTKEDRDNKRDPKYKSLFTSVQHKDIYQTYLEGIRDYATRIKRYREFRNDARYSRDGSASEISPNLPVGSPDNSRYKGNRISDAQNLFIRHLLSNLGNHSFSRKDRGETKRYFGGKCVYCGTANEEMTIDHAIPINKEKLGEHHLGNLVPACKKCNNKKGGQDYSEFCKDNTGAAQKIKDYMTNRNYVPLADDEEKAKRIRKILKIAHKEIGDAADRYVALLNDLFFSNE